MQKKPMDHSPAFLSLVLEAKKNIRECNVIQAVELSSQPHSALVDVREDHEFIAEHASNAIHLGRGILERDIEKRFPNLDTALILYCGGGFRSALAAHSLQQMGYTNVWSVEGGFKAWKQSSLPVSYNSD